MKRRVFLGTMLSALVALSAAPQAQTLDPENTLYLETKFGRTVIKLRPDLAPNHVSQIKKLAREGFYNNIKFHRVMPGFMAHTGDPTGTGTVGSELPNLKADVSLTPY